MEVVLSRGSAANNTVDPHSFTSSVLGLDEMCSRQQVALRRQERKIGWQLNFKAATSTLRTKRSKIPAMVRDQPYLLRLVSPASEPGSAANQ
ncbi:hypothetical protein I79_010871 [Cricetulus griseus]|uniref:Uncharacterized protein n=1 Tax=Cricetulus griseus TaxID=10029 RepID=G3HJM3_CRIGR|nr:hypothetical protein I79_010871 [Cricetulus griseus]